MKYNQSTIKAIIEAIKAGAGRVAACKHAGISYETFTVWMQKSEFSEQIERAEDEKREKIREACLHRVLQAAELDWRPAAWILEKYYLQKTGPEDKIDELIRKLEGK